MANTDAPDSLLMPLSAGELLEKLLEKHDIGPTELARRVGTDYRTVYRWTKNKFFNEKKQALVCTALNESVDYFKKHDVYLARENYRKRIFSEFLATEAARGATADELAVLASWQYQGPILPSVVQYKVGLLNLRGKLDVDVATEVIRFNDPVEESLRQKKDDELASKAKAQKARPKRSTKPVSKAKKRTRKAKRDSDEE